MLLADAIEEQRQDLEDLMTYFLEEPFFYQQEIVDEVLDILDRLETLSMKLANIDFEGCFRYESTQ